MRKYIRRIAVGVGLLALAALIAWAYSYVSPMTPRASKEWSRGRVVGRTVVNRPIALRPAPGGGVFLIWPDPEEHLRLVRIGPDGEKRLERVLEIGAQAARDPQLQVTPDGRLHILWREMGEPHATIRYALLEADGTLVGQPQVLSDPTHWAEGAPRLIQDRSGRLHALWADEVGIQWAVLSADGALLEGPVLLVAEGRSPAVQRDEEGLLHLSWQQWTGHNSRALYYATLDPQSGNLNNLEEMATVFRRTGQWVEGPALGLDPQTGYVLWSTVDMREVYYEGRYAFFPLELPRQKRINALQLQEGGNPRGICPLEGQRRPLLVALSETTPGSEWEPEQVQIAIVALAEERTPEYEIWGLAPWKIGGRRALSAQVPTPPATASPSGQPAGQGWEAEHIVTASSLPSLKPVLVMDERSYLHLAWLEPGGFDQYRVVYASTAPEVKQNYNALTLWDVVDVLFRRIFRLSFIVLVAVPMLVLWVLIPLGGLLIYHLVTGREELDTLASRLVLGVMLALEVALSLAFPPRSAAGWPPLRWVAPAATAAIAALISARILRDPDRVESLLFAWFFLFTGIHVLLLLVIYYAL